MTSKQIEDGINEIKAELVKLRAALAHERANTMAPGNPFICALSGQVSGLELALRLLEGRESL